jgi:divalent metal cation (Fe/Co/Zn/Cd) transporter
VDPHLTVVQGHVLSVAAEHALIHAVPPATAATVHTDHVPASQRPPRPLTHHAHT